MTKQNLSLADIDMLSVVIAKLNTVCDFFQILDDNFTLRKRTPEGVSLIIEECINALGKIGGLNEQTQC